MKAKKTYTARICVGFREVYTQRTHTIEEAYEICHEYCDKVGICVTVTPTRYIYTKGAGIADGWENGCFVEFICYPRYSVSRYELTGLAIDLAKIFIIKFKQTRISIITSDQTYLVEQNDIKGDKVGE